MILEIFFASVLKYLEYETIFRLDCVAIVAQVAEWP